MRILGHSGTGSWGGHKWQEMKQDPWIPSGFQLGHMVGWGWGAAATLGLPMSCVASLAKLHSDQACCPGLPGSLSPVPSGRRERGAEQGGPRARLPERLGGRGTSCVIVVTCPPQLRVYLPPGLSDALRLRDTPGLTPPG